MMQITKHEICIMTVNKHETCNDRVTNHETCKKICIAEDFTKKGNKQNRQTCLITRMI